MTTRYFTSDEVTPALLLRRTEEVDSIVDEVFRDGVWQPTKSIIDWMFGHDDFVDPVTEAKAREVAPEAFTSQP